MTLGLAAATALFGTGLLALGLAYLFGGSAWVAWHRTWPRSRRMAWILVGTGAAWFLWHVAHLGEADFGSYRWLLFAAFGFVAVGSFWHAPDFLAVRGATIVYLLGADLFLDAAFLREPGSRLFLVSAVYVGIGLSLWLAVSPFRLRDFHDWLYAAGNQRRGRVIGGALAGYGALLLLVAATYP